MSIVLWANHLRDSGDVVSDERDKRALFQHAAQLDRWASRAGVDPFSSLLDDTDSRFNLGDGMLPEGMTSTYELMARDGVWRSADEAVAILRGILTAIQAETPRFGLLRNDFAAVVAELAETIAYAEKARDLGAKFNLSIVT